MFDLSKSWWWMSDHINTPILMVLSTYSPPKHRSPQSGQSWAKPTLPEYLPRISQSKVTSDAGFKVSGGQEIDPRYLCALIDPSNQFIGLHITCSNHLRSPQILASKINILAVPHDVYGFKKLPRLGWENCFIDFMTRMLQSSCFNRRATTSFTQHPTKHSVQSLKIQRPHRPHYLCTVSLGSVQ